MTDYNKIEPMNGYDFVYTAVVTKFYGFTFRNEDEAEYFKDFCKNKILEFHELESILIYEDWFPRDYDYNGKEFGFDNCLTYVDKVVSAFASKVREATRETLLSRGDNIIAVERLKFQFQGLYGDIVSGNIKNELWEKVVRARLDTIDNYLGILKCNLIDNKNIRGNKKKTNYDLIFWEKNFERHLYKLFKILNERYVACKENEFLKHFSIGKNKPCTKKIPHITWRGVEVEIVILFNVLHEKEIIAGNKRWALVAQHFVNKKGKEFKPSQLKSVSGQLDKSKNISKSQEIYTNEINDLFP